MLPLNDITLAVVGNCISVIEICVQVNVPVFGTYVNGPVTLSIFKALVVPGPLVNMGWNIELVSVVVTDIVDAFDAVVAFPVNAPTNVVAVTKPVDGLQVILLLFCGWPWPVPDESEKFKKWVASAAVLTVFIVPVQSDWFNVFVVVPSVKLIVLLIFNVFEFVGGYLIAGLIFVIADDTNDVVAILVVLSGYVGAIVNVGVVVELNKLTVSFKQSIPPVVPCSCEWFAFSNNKFNEDDPATVPHVLIRNLLFEFQGTILIVGPLW